MSFTFLIFTALTGAAVLGFIFAWFWLQERIQGLEREKAAMGEVADVLNMTIEQLESEVSSGQLRLANLQKENRDIEGEMIKLQTTIRVMEGELKVLEREKRQLQQELNLLNEDMQNNIREIEVIREVPFIDPNSTQGEAKELSDLEKRIENAKRLVNAFKKGVSEDDKPRLE